jgi:anti-sigma regulatory factor (Ser/Thr protein kinase)
MRARPFHPANGTAVATHVFLRLPESAPQVRHFVTQTMNGWQMQDLADAVELVTSELAANAVEHARFGAFRVTLERLDGECVRVAVIDRSRTLPVRHFAEDDEDRGRGLAIVEAIAQKWDADLLRWGKRVWAELETPPQPAPPCSDVPKLTSRPAQLIYLLIVIAVAAFIVAAAATAQP